MNRFNLHSWMFENKVGVYSKDIITEDLDPEIGFVDGTVNRGNIEETVGWANIEKPSNSLLSVYLDKLDNFDWYYTSRRDFTSLTKGYNVRDELRQIYDRLSDSEKQEALDVYKQKVEKYFPERDYPSIIQLLKTLTTANFDGVL